MGGKVSSGGCGLFGRSSASDVPESKEELWTKWHTSLKASPNHCVLLHGILGGELYRIDVEKVIWLRLRSLWDPQLIEFDSQDEKNGDDNRVLAMNVVQIPFVGRFYNEISLMSPIRAAPWAWDWRNSAYRGGENFALFLRTRVMNDAALRAKGINIVCHSFGACVVTSMLGATTEFDDVIKSIVFLGPAFGGALNALQVLELGNGITTTVDVLVRAADIQRNVASYPSTFENMIAPEHLWVNELPLNKNGDTVKLRYPIVDANPWAMDADGLTNQYHTEKRKLFLELGRKHHENMHACRTEKLARMKEKIFVIVGMNGKTQFQAQKGDPSLKDPSFIIHSFQGMPGEDKIFNGDGAVVLQSSFIPCIDPDHHWAFVPRVGTYSHTSLPDERAVLQGIQLIHSRPVDGSYDAANLARQAGLSPYFDFIQRVDFKAERLDGPPPDYYRNLDYMMRWRMRTTRTTSDWTKFDLDPRDQRHSDSRDHILFAQVERAARRILAGENVATVSKSIGLDQLYVIHHALRMIAPQLASCTVPSLKRTPTEVLARDGSWKVPAALDDDDDD